MKKELKHLIIGTVICLVPMLLFFLFRDKLPDSVPVQITADGTAGNRIPKPVFIYVTPLIFAFANILRGLSLNGKPGVNMYNYYIVPGIVVAISVFALWMATNLA